MDGNHDIVSAWIAREIVPHDRAAHRWVSRRYGHVVDVEDVIQETYCRIAGLSSVDHIHNPAGYFFRTAYAVVMDTMRRANIISIASMTQIEWSHVMDDEPLADRAMEASQELDRVDDLLSGLSETSRTVIELRRIEGLSRKQTAERLGMSENDVKNHLVRGLQKMMRSMADQDARMSDDGAPNEQAKG